jgi:hypothetical protein
MTSNPNCLYYFGPFSSLEEILKNHPGYIKDLIKEGAQDITSTIRKYLPGLTNPNGENLCPHSE